MIPNSKNGQIRSPREEFDAVKMMREIRDKLSARYIKNPEAQEKDLQEIREKYRIKEKK